MKPILTSMVLACLCLSSYAQKDVELLPEGIVFPRLTIAERDVLSAQLGQCIFNTETNCVECYDSGGTWRSYRFSQIYDSDTDTYLTTEMNPDDDEINVVVNGNPALKIFENSNDMLVFEPRPQLDNTFFGGAGSGLFAEQTATGNTMFGSANGYLLSTGDFNTGIGVATLSGIGTGSGNVGIGYFALKTGADMSNNTVIGYEAATGNSANDIVAIGAHSLFGNSSGIQNTAVGTNSMMTNSTGFDNSVLGFDALKFGTGNYNTAMGSLALMQGGAGNHNSAFGYKALTKSTVGFNSAFGNEALAENSSGQSNSAVGMQALRDNTGNFNTAVGAFAGQLYGANSGSVFLGFEAGKNETADNRLHIANNAAESLIYGEFDNERVEVNGELQVRDMEMVSNDDKVVVRKADGTLAEQDNRLRVSFSGDTLYNGSNWVIVPGISAANPIVDGDGNPYTPITIGSQVWLLENLRTTKYNDGTPIAYFSNDTEFITLINNQQPAYTWYGNNSANAVPYGGLYSYHAVHPQYNGGKNMCPLGWHIPTETEWDALILHLGGSLVAGGELKETGTAHWNSPNTGATNSSGFTAVGGGFAAAGSYTVDFKLIAHYTGFDSSLNVPIMYYMSNTSSSINYLNFFFSDAKSVRCIQD